MIFVEWAPNNKTIYPQNYTVEYRKHSATKWIGIRGITETHTYIKDLDQNTVYYVQVFAVNIFGIGNKTTQYIVKTGILIHD